MRTYAVTFTVLTFITLAAAASAAQTQGYTPAGFEEEPGILFYMFQEDRFWQDGVFAARKTGPRNP